ncbi:hypothetical protein [Fodinibius salsisoli]|uniref:Type II secretory pathway, pseudopilin PulG n=1 Tax=Fodinibius salsisoli TaxID=2820877 RepID=A0ABT3PLH1_9BACT|nr:hypothetical protein [Fodinibius salsisoli]MCW9706806.1 hypothetical protein [Fodinibius salsisoli]
MGQQQLLLVILVTIIVGVATVVAINIFGQSAANANIDATRQDVLTLAAQMQGYALKPELMGGGGGDFVDLTVDKLGFGYDSDNSTSGVDFVNANAHFVIDPATGGITATPVRIDGSTDWTTEDFVATVTMDDITFDTVPAK